MAARGRAVGNLVETRALLRGVAIVVALSGLAGCTGNADAGPSPTTTVAVEPTASASAEAPPEKPQRPAAMDRDDAEGAAAAAEYFIELYPYVMATGDTGEFEGMSHEACGYCDGVIEDVTALHEAGQRFAGGSTHAIVIETYQQDGLTGVWPLDVEVEQKAAEVYDSDGREVATTGAREGLVRVEIGIKSDRWVVIGIVEQDEQ